LILKKGVLGALSLPFFLRKIIFDKLYLTVYSHRFHYPLSRIKTKDNMLLIRYAIPKLYLSYNSVGLQNTNIKLEL